MPKPAAQNIVLGAGYVHFAPYDANGDPQGRRYLGETPGFTISGSTERAEKWSSDGPIAERLKDIATRVTRSASVTVDNISEDNLALFLMGDASEVSQSGTSVTDERHTVDQGLWYQLGSGPNDFVGSRDVSAVTVVTDPDGTPVTMTEGTDYELNLALGLLYIIPGGGIAASAAEEIGVDYTEAAATWDQVVTSNLGPKDGLFYFRADNSEGANRDVLIPQASLTPNGDMAWKSRDTFMSMQFDVRISKRAGVEQVYVNGRPA
jgi:hypothetical protein